MFSGNYVLEELDVSNWDVSKVTTFSNLFASEHQNGGDMKLKKLDVSKWNPVSVTDMGGMFYGCGALTEIDMSNWNLPNLTTVSHMFADCYNLETVDVSGWQTPALTNLDAMFNDCRKLKEVDMSSFDTSNVTIFGQLFEVCYSTEHEITISVVDNLDGTISAVANVTEVLFVNVYDPEDAVIYVGGLKKLDGAELKKGMFSFALHQANENFELMNVIQTTSNNADGTFVFEKLYCPTVGVFYFAVTEDASNPLEGMTYDKSVYGLKVTVTDDGNGQLSASVDVTEVGNTQNAEIVFENVYEPVEQPTDPTKPSKPDSPGTGDQPSLARYYVLTAVSVLLLWLVCKQYKRPEEN